MWKFNIGYLPSTFFCARLLQRTHASFEESFRETRPLLNIPTVTTTKSSCNPCVQNVFYPLSPYFSVFSFFSIEMHKTLTLESQNATAAMNHAASATPAGQGAPSAVSQGAPPTHSTAPTLGGGATPPGAATHVPHPQPPTAMVSLAGPTAHSMGLPMGLTATAMGTMGLKPMPLLGLGGIPGMLDPTTAAAAAAAAVANRKYQQAATAAALTTKLKTASGTGANLVAASSIKTDQRVAKFAPY